MKKPSYQQLFALGRARATTVTPAMVNSGGLGVAAKTWRWLFEKGLLEYDFAARATPTTEGLEVLATWKRVPGSRRVREVGS